VIEMLNRVLEKTAFDIVSTHLMRDGGPEGKCFRIKNFTVEEGVIFTQIWKEQAVNQNLKGVALIVAGEFSESIPNEYCADPGFTITFYRNKNLLNGLVYIETKVQSDEQGLKNMFTLHDSNFLDNSFSLHDADERFSVPHVLIENTWQELGGLGSAPNLISVRLLEVLSCLHTISVRKYIKFVIGVLREYLIKNKALSEKDLNELIGEHFVLLDFFPDRHWHEHGDIKKVERRIYLNSNYSELVHGSADIDPKILCEKIENFQFKDEDDEPLAQVENVKLARLCANFVKTLDGSIRSQIPLFFFLQLFSPDIAGLKLGEKVQKEIVEKDSSRLSELAYLNVVDGLNSKFEEDAKKFLEADTDEDGVTVSPALRDMLSVATRRLVEQLANPKSQAFFNPMLEIVDIVENFKSLYPESVDGIKLEMELHPSANFENLSIPLLNFLYGASLRQSEKLCSEDAPGISLSVDKRIYQTITPPEYKVDEDEVELEGGEDGQANIIWEPVPLLFKFYDKSGNIAHIVSKREWYPSYDNLHYFAFLWLLCCAEESKLASAYGLLQLPQGKDFASCLKDFTSRALPITFINFDSKSDISSYTLEVSSLRNNFLLDLSKEGLNLESINEYLDNWLPWFERSRVDYVPAGSKIPEVSALLDADFLAHGSVSRLMLPTHPIKLRWISHYLHECITLLAAIMSGDEELSRINPHLYLDWLENLSPSQAPSIALGANSSILFSGAEQGWFEEYIPRNYEISGAALDVQSITRITRQIVSYLEAHPYKRDGLSILIVLPYTDKFPADLIQSFRSGEWKDVNVNLTVIAPKSRWNNISRNFDDIQLESRMSLGGRLFPPCNLSFIDSDFSSTLIGLLDTQVFDLAVVTHLLNEQVNIQPNTDIPNSLGLSFDPLYDRPTYIKGGEGGGAISLLMKPEEQDIYLETWSTHVVRSERLSPIAPQQPENTDSLELRINFEESAKLFVALHKSCHWVITLERHITRQQIESLEVSPDILSIQEGIGSNNNLTLIVSANSGKELVISRLKRKLHTLIKDKATLESHNLTIESLARMTYEQTRRFAPKLALKAMGISRVTEEIIGLMVARSLSFMKPVGSFDGSLGFCATLSLDEYSNWVGGSSEVRADICNLKFELHDDELKIGIEIIEGKLRQVYSRHGVDQVLATIDFFKDILASKDRVDSKLWRNQIISAIEGSDINMINYWGLDSESLNKKIPDPILKKFKDGKFHIVSIDGIYSSCNWEEENKKISQEQDSSVLVIKSYANDIVPLILHSISRNESSIDFAQPTKINEVIGEVIEVSSKSISESESIENGNSQVQRSNLDLVSNSNNDIKLGSSKTSRKKMSDIELRGIYQSILDAYAKHGVDVEAVSSNEIPYIEGPASIIFKLLTRGATDPKKLTDKGQVLKLILKLDEKQNISFSIDKGYVNMDVPKSSSQRYYVKAVDLWESWQRPINGLSAPLGEDQQGNPVAMNFSDNNSPHLLIGGTTGSGKSEALNILLFGLVKFYSPEDLKLILVDPKGTELEKFSEIPHLLHPIGIDDVEALDLLKIAVGEMQARYEKIRSTRSRTIAEFNSKVPKEEQLPRWLIVLDEYGDLTQDPNSKKLIEHELIRIAQKARAAGIHVVIATQKPSADVISTNLRSNLPAQLSLRVKSATESRVIMDQGGAEMLNGNGDAYFKLGGSVTRVQCGLVSEADSNDVLDKL
jgi:S-DNA-T family DNA segregation ATPase FtsK/SpoIIIE